MTIILMALQKESNGLIEATAQAADIKIFYTGIGLIAAASKTAEVIVTHKPTAILNIGTAGSRHLEIGSLVEGIKFSNRTKEQLESIKYSIEVSPITNLSKGHIGSADHIDMSDSASDFEVLDMEAYAMALVCKKMKVQFNSIKYITDDSRSNFTEKWNQELKASSISLQNILSDLIQTKVIG